MTQPPFLDIQRYKLNSQSDLALAIQNLITRAVDGQAEDAFIGQGSAWQAFKLEHNGKAYVVKIANNGQHSPDSTTEKAKDLVMGSNVANVENLVTYDDEHGIIVTTRIPGKRLIDLTAEELARIPSSHFRKAIETIVNATRAGIVVDPKPTNFLYDPKAGFGIVDYSYSELESPHSIEYLNRIQSGITGLAGAIQNVGFYGKVPTTDLEKQEAILAIETGYLASERFLGEVAKNTALIPPTSYLGIAQDVRANQNMMLMTSAHYAADIGLGPRPGLSNPGRDL